MLTKPVRRGEARLRQLRALRYPLRFRSLAANWRGPVIVKVTSRLQCRPRRALHDAAPWSGPATKRLGRPDETAPASTGASRDFSAIRRRDSGVVFNSFNVNGLSFERCRC